MNLDDFGVGVANRVGLVSAEFAQVIQRRVESGEPQQISCQLLADGGFLAPAIDGEFDGSVQLSHVVRVVHDGLAFCVGPGLGASHLLSMAAPPAKARKFSARMLSIAVRGATVETAMNEPARLPRRDHPLVADRPRLDRIIDAMSVQIQKVIYRGRVTSEVERVLSSGESMDDVLQEALLGLLNTDPDALRETWERLGIRVAHNKAVDAVRRATKGRRTAAADPDAPDELAAVSLDAIELELRDDRDDADPEERFVRYQQELVLLRLARDRLDEREKTVYFGIHFQGRTRAELAGELGLSPQGVGQIYVRIAKALDAEACRDPSFPTTRIPEGRTE